MNPKELARLELQKRSKQQASILQECLPYQLEFIQHQAKRKAVLGTRRSAKSYMFALYFLNQAMTVPKSTCLYAGLTMESAERTMWRDIFEIIILKYELQAELTSKHEIVFKNGSVIYLYGLDATENRKNVLRGQKYDIAVIDEVQDFKQDLTEIIDGVLRIALAQTGATLCLGGTPSNAVGKHLWWLIHQPNSTLNEWHRFFFDWRNNTSIEPKTNKRVCDAIQEDVEKQINNNPLVQETDIFKREYLGQWITLDNTLVYKFKQPHNIIQDLSVLNAIQTDKLWLRVMGIDFGARDACAFTILAFHRHLPDCYIIHSEKHVEWSITDMANRARQLKEQYGHITYIVGDSSATQSILEINKHHPGLYIEPSERQGKHGFVNIMNADFITGNIKIDPINCQELISELEELILDERELRLGKMSEDPSKENHCTDSMLYAYRKSRHYRVKPAPAQTPETVDDSTYRQMVKQGIIKPKYQSVLPKSIFDQPTNAEIIEQYKLNRKS